MKLIESYLQTCNGLLQKADLVARKNKSLNSRLAYSLTCLRIRFQYSLINTKGIKNRAKILASRLFDEDYYLANNPDVRTSNTYPLAHFMKYGAFEGRFPNPIFDPVYYLKTNPDVKKSGINPLLHYILHGEVEGREPFPNIFATDCYSDYKNNRSSNSGFLRYCIDYLGYGKVVSEIFEKDIKSASKLTGIQHLDQAQFSSRCIDNAATKSILSSIKSDKKHIEKSSSINSISKLSIIILNLNGCTLLDKLFASFTEHIKFPVHEIIVVDHNSSDQSLEVLKSYSQKLPITIVECKQNFSFSYSNNRAVERASGDVILFLNNDIVFEQDCITSAINLLNNPSIGVVGIKLYEESVNQNFSPVVLEDDYHHIGVRFKPDFNSLFYRPYNARPSFQDVLIKDFPACFSVVTAAFMLLRRDEFLSIGGFSEAYEYGYEDVDLCLKYRFSISKKVVCSNDFYAVHADGKTRKKADLKDKQRRRLVNDKAFRQRFGYLLRRQIRCERLTDDGSLGYGPLHIAFAVTEALETTKAGDFFTALELGQSLSRKFGYRISYLPLDDWYCLSGVDVVIAMRDDFDPDKIEVCEPHLVKVAWLRNWFERWIEFNKLSHFNIVACSSNLSKEYVSETTGLPTELLRIASNPNRFSLKGSFTKENIDYVFTGSYWGVKREIIDCLNPQALPQYKGAIYGYGWQAYEPFMPIYKGFLNYAGLPSIYRSSKIAIDDANHVTKAFGSINSRVFDALVSGTLVVSNGKVGVQEIFGDLLPTYDSRESLMELLNTYLSKPSLLKETVQKLRQTVLNAHTYEHRSDELRIMLQAYARDMLSVSIKIPVPDISQQEEWGDYHFAKSLGKEIRKYGHSVRIDAMPDWDCPDSLEDDVVIVLRGLSEYIPHPDKINILWNISHPDKVSEEEYEKYDHVFIASLEYSKQLQASLNVPVSPLIQCTDPDIFFPTQSTKSQEKSTLLFVGNSRKVFRKSVKYSIQKGLNLSVYGTRWRDLIPAEYLKGEHIPNHALHRYYGNAEIVLNDHWESMAKLGFLSNRLFDVGASMGFVISDYASGIDSVFADAIPTYRNQDEFNQLVDFFMSRPDKRKQKAKHLHQTVIENHTFADRADKILEVVRDLAVKKLEHPQDLPLKNRDGAFPISVPRKNSLLLQ